MADETPQGDSQTAAGRYESLVADRQPFLTRGREYAALTIPALLPPEGSNGATDLYQPFQSVGADGTNNLASKILLALFPPGASFVRYRMDEFVEDQLLAKAKASGGDPEDAKAEFEDAFGKIERSMSNKLEATGSRTVHFEVLQHLIVTGNALVNMRDDAKEKMFPIDRYVLKRDLDDNVLEIVVKESVSKTALDPRARALLEANPESDKKGDAKSHDIYTWVQRKDDGSWTERQEICGKVIPGTEATYPKDACAWIPLRWRRVPNQDYGRGRCEEYAGDLRSLEVLSKAIVMFAAAASKVLFLVDESGTTSKEALAGAESGDFLDGNAKDVTTLQLEKQLDFQIANTKAEELRQRLERAFLMASAVQRQAERVTAEEIRAMIGELEQSLGGVYSILAEEFQRPLVMRLRAVMEKRRELPPLPKGVVSPQIVTGLDGLGRSSDLQRLDMFIAGAEQQFGQQFLSQWINIGNYLTRRATALGIDVSGLVRTQQEIDAQNQAQQQQAMVQKLGPAGIKAISDHMQAATQAQQAQTPLAGAVPQ